MNTKQQELVQRIADEVKDRLEGDEPGHDWWHTMRVWKLAKQMNKSEGGDQCTVELAALLHDIADWKNYDGDVLIGPKVAREILERHDVAVEIVNQICEIIEHLSFKGAGVPSVMKTIEGKIVQDADRLDAIGAIGLARVFAYTGNKNRAIHIPDSQPVLHQTKEAYLQGGASAIKHCYEKLLLLKDRMNTNTAKKLAEHRHEYMEKFIEEFMKEWEGKI